MNLPLHIARRYLFSKKSSNAINWISGISMVGVTVATTALVVTLSVFNGFQDLVASLFTTFDPQIQVVPTKGKTVAADHPVLTKLREMPEVEVASECLQDQALAMYEGRQQMIMVMGVDDRFRDLTHIQDILCGNGSFELHAANLEYAIPGVQLCQLLGMGTDWNGTLKVYAPEREGQLDMANPETGFRVDSLMPSGVAFQVKQSRYDRNYLVTSIGFARNLFDGQGMVSRLAFRLKDGYDVKDVASRMQIICGEEFRVQDRYEQQEDTFRMMEIEKLMAYIFLSLILVVACFNIVGSLSMLIIEKTDDVATLSNLGMRPSSISRIFLLEGWLISGAGAVVGIIIGLILCWAQMEFGLVGLGQSSGSFIIDSYPVSVHATDIIAVFLTVVAVGFLASWYPVRAFRKLQK